MARHCHEASYVAADPFTNVFVFFMSDSMKAVNPFIDRIPRELQEKFMTDCVTEYIKINTGVQNNNPDDGVISFKYGLMVAFARKTWKLQPSIGGYVQIWPISEVRLVINTAKQPTHTPHTRLRTVICVWKKKDYTHTPNNVLNHTCISICVYCCFKLLFT